MNLLKGCLTTLALFGIAFIGFGQEKKDTLKLSVADAKKYALENNRSILNANIDVESAKKKVWETTAIGLPQVSAKGNFQYTPELSSTIEQFSGLNSLGSWMYIADQELSKLGGNPDFGKIPNPGPPKPYNPDDMKWSLTGDLIVSQLIFNGSYLVGLQSAKVYKSLSELNRVKSVQDVMESITNTYYSVLIARRNAQILDSTYINVQTTLNQMEKMLGQGFVEETDVDQLKITATTIKSNLDFIVRMVVVSEKMLKLQLGIDFDAPVTLTDELDNLINSQAYDQLLLADFVLEGNINYQMLDAQVKANELLLKLRKSECLPSLAAFYQYEKNFNKNAFTFTPPHVIGATLEIPIFASGSRSAKIKQAKFDLDKSLNNRKELSEGLKVQFFQSKSSLINAKEKFAADKQNMQLADKIYKRSLIKYTNGIISSLELTQAQNQYLAAQSNYFQSVQNLISEKNKLEKMLTKN